jgi:hypothetical protein
MFDVKEDKTGYLIPFYLKKIDDFKRFFIIKNKKAGDVRGNHAHKRDSQVIILLNGSCEIEFENKEKKSKQILEFGIPYFSKPYEWLKINMLKPNTILLVLCREEYDEEEYIRNYDDFKNFKLEITE